MKNLICMIAVVLAFTAGCSMCCGPFDYDYPAFGGKHTRANRAYGRVGSVLSDPTGAALFGGSADSNLTPQPEPISSDDDDDDDLDLDDLDDPDTDSDLKRQMRELDEELEGIEPLRNDDSMDSPSQDSTDDNTTASYRWRPRPLRKHIR